MNKPKTHSYLRTLAFLFIMFAASVYTACSNSEGMDYANYAPVDKDISYDEINSKSLDESSSSKVIDYLPLDDTEYPYAGIPRIVIETNNQREIKDRETKIPAKLQIWGEKAPESEVMELTIRGRGNTSWGMPKKSYKIEFTNKQSILGMPKDRDWALIANYADKTLMKNYLMYHLSSVLEAYYAPKCEFIELYLNNEYLGVYLLTETIKTAKHRINTPNDNKTYIVEADRKYRKEEQIVRSYVINDSIEQVFRIHEPHNISENEVNTLKEHIQNFEKFIKSIHKKEDNKISQWINIEEYIKHYWVQEFSKNPDATFITSTFFSWRPEDVIKMGPVWDFDISCGGINIDRINSFANWYIKDGYWNFYLFQDSVMENARRDFWLLNKDKFKSTIRTIDSTETFLQKAATNNFRRWNILHSTDYALHLHAYQSYGDAANDLKEWINQRILWIENHI